MPKTRTLEDVTEDREALEKSLSSVETDVKKAKTALGKAFSEHDAIRTALLEGLEEIKDTKARAREEVKGLIDTWTKMAAKLDTIADKARTAGKDVTKILAELKATDTSAAALTKELTKVGGDIKGIKAETLALKAVDSDAERMRFEMDDLNTQVKEIRDAPPKPDAAF